MFEKLHLCCETDFCSSNGRTSSENDDALFSYILNADSRTVALYIVVFTLILPFMLYKYLDYLPQIINFSRRTNNNKEDVPLKKRIAYMVDVFFSIYPYAKLLALLFATLFLIRFGGLALYVVTGGSFAEALWHSWTYVATFAVCCLLLAAHILLPENMSSIMHRTEFGAESLLQRAI